MARGGMLRYGWVEGPGKGREYKVAASQYFHRQGGRFVYANSAGHLTLATTNNVGTGLVGWVEPPKHAAGYNSWKSSTTAGADKVFCVTGMEDKFEMPLDTASASANATLVGKGGNCQASSTTATYAMKQKFYYRATTASCNLLVEDYDADLQTVTVRMRPSEKSIT